MKITNPITLDVARSNSYICLLAKQFDENSRFLIATLTNNGKPMIIPAGATVTLRATRPDGEPVAVPGIINNDGTTTVEIDDYILEVVGSASLSIEVAIGDEILTSASFNLTIQRADGNGWLRVYVAAASLAAGNYYITIGDTPYAFTTTQAIPAGGSVYFASEGGTAQTRDASGNVLDASLPVTIASTGTELTSDVPTMSFLAAIAGRMATIEAEMSQKANIDGSYPLLNAGSADNLMTDNGATQAIPFIQEGTGKGNGEATVKAGGVLQLKKKLGNTVGVNQLQKTQGLQATGTIDGVTFSNTGTAAHISGTAGADIGTVYFNRTDYATNTIPGHTYLLFGCPASGGLDKFYLEPLMGVGADWCKGYPKDIGKGAIFEAKTTSDTPAYIYGIRLFVKNGATNLDANVNCFLIDLTLWFGSNDRIPSDLLSHPENWGRYHAGSLAYNAGTLESADGSILTSLPRNFINPATNENNQILIWANGNLYAESKSVTTDFYPVIPNTAYATNYYAHVFAYDKDKNYIGNWNANTNTWVTSAGTFVKTLTISGCAFVRFVFRSAANGNEDMTTKTLVASLYYPGESGYDADYPFSVLAEVDTGSEVLRSAGSVADEKTPDGTLTRRVGYVDLGTLTWNKGSGTVVQEWYILNAGFPGIKAGTLNLQSAKFIAQGGNGEGTMNASGVAVRFYTDAYATTDAIKTAMSGVYLYYELSTPTTEQGTAYAENIPCDDFGSLMWTQTKGIPQGNEIFYPTDLKGALESIVAALPSADGTYTLKATISGGVVTYSWS